MIAWALAACGSGALPVQPPQASSTWVIGFAANAKQGAMVVTPDGAVRCASRAAWPDNEVGAPVVLEGALASVEHDEPLVDEAGERAAGASGVERIVTPCSVPPRSDAGQLAAEEALFAAIAARDRSGIEAAIAPEVALHIDGAPPTLTRAQLIDAILATPGEITAVRGEKLVAHTGSAQAIVRGVQIVSRTGEPDDRTRFLDVFVRRGDRWVIVAIFAS